MRQDRTTVDITDCLSGVVSGTVITHREDTIDSKGETRGWHRSTPKTATDSLEGNDIRLGDEVVGQVTNTSHDWSGSVIFDARIDPEIARSIRIGRLRLEAILRYEEDIINFGDMIVNEN